MYKFTFVLLMLVGFCFQSKAQSFKIRYGNAEEIGVIANSRINEASGLASSYNTTGAFWVHNDSGDGPNLFLVDSTGNTLASGSVFNATSRDWEDMASFVYKDTSYLLVADVGDNPINKSEYWLYLIKEPEYDSQNTTGNSYQIYRTIEFQYENGSQNCESVGVDVWDKKIILVSKSGSGNGERYVYEIPMVVEKGTETTTAKLIGQFEMDGTTAMDISNDGQRAIVLTYQDAYEFTKFLGSSWADAFAVAPRKISMPSRPGGEAIAYGRNGVELYLVREGNSSPLWFIRGEQDDGTVFQVDMFEKADIYNDKVWVKFQNNDSLFAMTDTDNDAIYATKVNLETDSIFNFYFAYQNSPDSIENLTIEQVPSDCHGEEGFRSVYLDRQNLMLKPYIFGSCEERPFYVNIKVDMGNVTELLDNGRVWVYLPQKDTLLSMTKNNEKTIYNLTLSGQAGKQLDYAFCYQNGTMEERDTIYEVVSAQCASQTGYRTYVFNNEMAELVAVEFGTCEEALPEGDDVTDLENVQIKGSNDEFPWEGATEGSGSPDGEKVEMLIDNDLNTKYLVRDTDSWVDIFLPNLTMLHAYTITSGKDIPSRDPRSWEFFGWNMQTGKWELLHAVDDNPEWQERMQRKSWPFNNNNWYAKYRLHIHEINGNPQLLMQMTELQLFGEVGDEVQWSGDATLKELNVEGAELMPAFDPGIYNYNVELPQHSMNITINATANHENATLTGTGNFLLLMLSEAPVVTVVAEDGITTNKYTVNYTVLTDESGVKAPENNFVVYPVPSSGKITVKKADESEFLYKVYDVQGGLVKKGVFQSKTSILDLSGQKKGIYFIRLENERVAENLKLVLY